ncbi:MAG: flagellar M-ring protein FliF [Bacillota bacterium]|nr:MAG: flagellar M-ring protein FliF [Bacillota bacterium]
MWSVAVVALLVVIGSASYYSTRVQFVPLFSGLDARQANSIVESLKQEKVAYQLVDEGTAIHVPQGMVHELKIRISGEGLYNSGIGYELFDQVKLGITDFERRLNYQRALEEELRRTISFYPEIEQVRVHLVIPEPSVFLQTADSASASITLKLRPFQTLTAEKVKGMSYLVALSVPKLKPENVSIIDVGGRILTDGLVLGSDDSNPTAAKQTELKRSFEHELELKLVQMLERIYGPGKAVAVVTADMSFDQESVTRIVYDKDGQIVRSEQVREESYSGSTGSGGGVPGTGSNIPTYPVGSADSGNNTYSSTDRSTEYEIDTTQTTVIIAPGKVLRLSTAVSVNATLSEDQKQELDRLVKAALGYSDDRGDSIIVSALNFNMDHVDAARQEMADLLKRDQTRQYINYGIMAAGVLLGFILLLIVIGKISRALKFEVPRTEAVNFVPLQQALAEAAAARTLTESEVALNRVKELAKSQPDEVAMMIKAWFSEG